MLLILSGPKASLALGMIDEELFVEFIAWVTAPGMPLEGLLHDTTIIAVGVERQAAGIEDNPLADLIDDVEAQYGSIVANIVEQAFDNLIEQLGPNLIADVDPIVLPPDFDVDNGLPDVATVLLPIGPYILDIGPTHNVGDGELARIVMGLVDSDGDDNDAEQILYEMFTGTSGAHLDFEEELGIVGVDLLLDLNSLDEFTLVLEDGDVSDILTLAGPGVEAVLAKLDAEGVLIPEPGTGLLLGLGLIALANRRTRRRFGR
jgi:hypothetical protein